MTRLLQLGVVALVLWGFGGLSPAGFGEDRVILTGPVLPQGINAGETVILESPPVVGEGPWQAEPAYTGPAPQPTSRVGDWLRRHGICCYSHHDSVGCGNLKAELVYIFGSCHAWYGEPCFTGPQDPVAAYRQRAAQPKGCACP